MRSGEPHFYPEQVVTGRVVAMNDWFATIDIQGQALPLENRFIHWQSPDQPSDLLMLGQRLQAVVHERHCKDMYSCRTLVPGVFWHGYWLDCLPLLEDPWPRFKALHPKGTILEVEFLEYINLYVSKARTEAGFVIELMNRDLVCKGQTSRDEEILVSHQFLKIVIHAFSERTVRVKRLQ
jgi:hypothetical protein